MILYPGFLLSTYSLPDVVVLLTLRLGNASLAQFCNLPVLENFHIVTGLCILQNSTTSRFQEIIPICCL